MIQSRKDPGEENADNICLREEKVNMISYSTSIVRPIIQGYSQAYASSPSSKVQGLQVPPNIHAESQGAEVSDSASQVCIGNISPTLANARAKAKA